MKLELIRSTILLRGLLHLTALTFFGLKGFALPAFPGAEGYGADTPGGRGGQVFLVTTTQDEKPAQGGSLRAAVEASGPRIVVFRVSGIITLVDSLDITNPYITIAGQTAPGDGICIRRRETTIPTHDVIIRHIRFRLGDQTTGDSTEIDPITIQGGSNIVLDHCSFSWSMDECIDISSVATSDNITVQWCTITEALRCSRNPEGCHGYGALIRPHQGHVTFHHNLFANNDGRNPRVGTYDGKVLRFDFRNNVIYNWGPDSSGASGATNEFVEMTYTGNWLHTGPDTNDDPEIAFNSRSPVPGNPEMPGWTRIFQQGNLIDGTDTGWSMFKGELEKMPAPFDTPRVTTDDALTAREKVLNSAGATLPKRDAVDQRAVNDVLSSGEEGRLIDSQTEVGGWPSYNTAAAPADGDLDGMPNAWESQYGLNPQLEGDGNADPEGDGYTNIEEYLNGTSPAVDDSRTGVHSSPWSEIE